MLANQRFTLLTNRVPIRDGKLEFPVYTALDKMDFSAKV